MLSMDSIYVPNLYCGSLINRRDNKSFARLLIVGGNVNSAFMIFSNMTFSDSSCCDGDSIYEYY